MTISAQVLFAEKSLGSVDRVCSSVNAPLRGVVGEHADRGAHFVDDIDEFAVGRKSQMARAGARRDGRKRRVVRDEFGRIRVEAIDEHLVQAEVAIERKAVVG